MRWLGLYLWCNAQVIGFQKAYGGSLAETAIWSIATGEETFYLAGHTRSQDGDLSYRKNYDSDLWLLKLDSRGRPIWSKAYGGSFTEELAGGVLMPDKGVVLLGYTESPQYTQGKRDALALRVDPLGEVMWLRTYGGEGNDLLAGGCLAPNGDLWLVGQTGSQTGLISHNEGGIDAWLLCVDPQGNPRFSYTFGGPGNDYFRAIVPFTGGNFLIVGATDSPSGDVLISKGKTDIWVLVVDSLGNPKKIKNLGGESYEEPHAVMYAEGLWWIGATSFSKGGDRKTPTWGMGDIWVFALDADLEIVAQYAYGGSADEGVNHILIQDSFLYVAGMTRSRDGQIDTLKGLYDGWLLIQNLRDSHFVSWVGGGKENDAFVGIFPRGRYRVLGLGHSASTDGDLFHVPKQGSLDFWAIEVRWDTGQVASTTSRVRGYVRDPEKKPLSARLFVYRRDSLVDTLQADERGFYEVSLEGDGPWYIAAQVTGYFFFYGPLRDCPGSECRQDITLQPIQMGQVKQMWYVHFDKGRANLLPASYPQLEALRSFLVSNPRVRIQLAGHTDGTSRIESEVQLSRRRAEAVKNYLVARGISASRIHTVGYGKARPIADNATPEGQRKNRRVEFRVLGL
ncbi:MAG: OmpA family protein [Bacteroidia bacterium]